MSWRLVSTAVQAIGVVCLIGSLGVPLRVVPYTVSIGTLLLVVPFVLTHGEYPQAQSVDSEGAGR